jgi:hypothetical protein
MRIAGPLARRSRCWRGRFALGPATEIDGLGFLCPIPDCFPDCSENFFIGSIQWSCSAGLLRPATLAGPGKKAFLFFYDPMIAWGMAKAILNSAVLLKIKQIRVEIFCHRPWRTG